MLDITSLQNPRVKQIVKLRDDKKQRQRDGLMLVEGYDEISLALGAVHTPRTLLIAPELARRKMEDVEAEIVTVSPPVFEKMSMRENPDGWLEIAEFRAELHAWLDAHHDEVAPPFDPPRTSTSASPTCSGRRGSSTRRGGCAGAATSGSAGPGRGSTTTTRTIGCSEAHC